MTDPTPNSGQFAANKVTREAVPVDCSDWVDTSTGWTFGNFVTEKVTREASTIDCSEWDSAQPQLQVSVQFEDGELSDSFVQAIRQTNPSVQLERDPSTTVVLALPNHNAVAALYGAFQGLEAAGCVIGSEHGTFRVRRKAS
jgi:hypothetical protein